MKILIIDDDAVFVNGMKKLLELRIIPAVMATNVTEVKKILKEEEISLICADWDLGDGTGLEVLQYATEKNIPVVFFTGHDEGFYKEKAMSLGAARYYIKGQTNYKNLINELITLSVWQHPKSPQKEVSNIVEAPKNAASAILGASF